MSEQKSEVQNLTEPTVANEPLDASPLAAEADQVEDGAPKDYPKDIVGKDGQPYPTQERPAT